MARQRDRGREKRTQDPIQNADEDELPTEQMAAVAVMAMIMSNYPVRLIYTHIRSGGLAPNEGNWDSLSEQEQELWSQADAEFLGFADHVGIDDETTVIELAQKFNDRSG